jgi:hypothetical protein
VYCVTPTGPQTSGSYPTLPEICDYLCSTRRRIGCRSQHQLPCTTPAARVAHTVTETILQPRYLVVLVAREMRGFNLHGKRT